MADSGARKYQATSPKVNSSDYDNNKLDGRDKGRDSKEVAGDKKRIFSDEKTPPTWWGCPRWACLLIFFILFGILSGLTTWLIIKNQIFNVDNPQYKIQYQKIKDYNQEQKKIETLDANLQALNVTISNQTANAKHYRRNFHHYEPINYD